MLVEMSDNLSYKPGQYEKEEITR